MSPGHGPAASKGKPVKARKPTVPDSRRGVWAHADFQLYINEMDPARSSVTEWAMLGKKGN